MLSNILQKLKDDKKSAAILFSCILVVLYFIFYAIFGTRGVLDYFALKSEFKERTKIKEELDIKIQNKQNLVDRMQNDSLDLDLLDEQVRKNLGYAKKKEIIIYEKNQNEEFNK